MSGGPEVRQRASELGRVLAEHQTILYGVDQRARCTCGWIGGTGSWEPTLHRRDALLPVVERIAAERAAEELDGWARSFRAVGQAGIRRDNRRVFPQVAAVLEAGARDLRAEAMAAGRQVSR